MSSDAGTCSCTGTLKCFSTLGGSGGAAATATATGMTAAGSGWGTVMALEQEGHSMEDPAPVASTSNSWSQIGHLKLMSIINLGENERNAAAKRKRGKSFWNN